MPPQESSSSDDAGALERVRRRLYAPQAPGAVPVPGLSQNAPSQIPANWLPEDAHPRPPEKHHVSWSALFLIGAAVLFLLSVGAAAYFLIFGTRAISSDRVTIAVTDDHQGAIGSGDTVNLLISIKNGNPAVATGTTLSIEFPDSARDATASSTPLGHYTDDAIGDIAPGQTATRSVRAVLFGAENEQITLPLRFEYRVAGSNAVFVKEATYTLQVTSSPLSLQAQAVSEIVAGQPLTFNVTVRSNAKTPLDHVAVTAAYPFGFIPKSGQTSLLPVGTLLPGEEKTVTFSGSLGGENNDERVFHFSVGTRTSDDAPALAATYSTIDAPVTLAKPFLTPTLSIDHDASTTPTVATGATVQGLLSWVNTTASVLEDAQITVKLSGNGFDPSSVGTFGGFYRSSDTTVLFSRDTDPTLAELAQGATGSGSFTFKTKTAADLTAVRNPTVIVNVSVTGRRPGESNVPESVTNAISRTVKIGTDLALSAKSLYSSGPFKNTGPLPPVADKETTYTIALSLSNSVNSVGTAAVTATLPSYVRYLGKVSPSDGSLRYDDATRTITWSPGDVPAGAGTSASAVAVSFQVALLPSASQRGTSPMLLSAQQVTGVDRFTQKSISFTHPAVTTQSFGDPSFQPTLGTVQ